MNPETIEVAKQAIESATSVKGIAIGAGTAGPPIYVAASKACEVNYLDPSIIISLCVSMMTGYLVFLQIRIIRSKNKSK